MKSSFKVTLRGKELKQDANLFANIVFTIAIIYSINIIIYAIYKLINSGYNIYYTILIIIGGFVIILFCVCFSLRIELKLNFSLLLISIIIIFLIFETYLQYLYMYTYNQFNNPNNLRYKIAEEMEYQYDKRTQKQIIDDLAKSGNTAYPNVYPNIFISLNGLVAEEDRIFPLGGISNAIITNCNEGGYWAIFKSDEYGFNNSTGYYQDNEVDIMLVGDSYTEGACVQSSKTIGATLRKYGYNATSIGKGGNGPLIEYATLKEYAEPSQPKIVVWLYFENDLSELTTEMSSSLLRKYLYKDDYTQHLISRQNEINSVLVEYIREKSINSDRTNYMEKDIKFYKIDWVKRILTFSNIRAMLHIKPEFFIISTFKNILLKSKNMVSKWGGELYFVYLPSFESNYTGKRNPYYSYVIGAIKEFGIPVIDVHKEIFAQHPDPLSLFPFRSHGHYNAEGYRLISSLISKKLEKDNIFPANSK